MRHSAPSRPRGNRTASNRRRDCSGCKEPSDFTRPLKEALRDLRSPLADDPRVEDKHICSGCEARLKAKKDAAEADERARRQDLRDINDARRNERGDRRRGWEEAYYGPEFD